MLLISCARRRRYQAGGIRRPAAADRQHRLAVRLHAAICRIAGIVDRVSRSRPDHHRRSLQRFRRQEPGGASEIAETAQHQYGVTFPIAAKAVVKGPNAHPFYKWAAGARPKDVPRWNFHKYLIGRDGYIARCSRRPSNRRTRASKPPLRGRSRRPDASFAPELTGSTDKSAGGQESRCRGGAGPTRLLSSGQERLGRWRKAAAGHGIS